MSGRKISRSVLAYERGARLAVWLQVVVAVAAVALSIALGLIIRQQQSQIRTNDVAIQRGASIIDGNAQALSKVQRALSILARGGYSADLAKQAIQDLKDADRILARVEGAGSQAQKRDDLRRPILRALGHAQYQNDLYTDAAQSLAALRALHEPDATTQITDTIELAAYYCAAQNFDAARTLVGGDFSGRSLLSQTEPFSTRCASLSESLPNTAAAAPADPQFAIRSVNLQISNDVQRGHANRVAGSVCSAGYSVSSVQKAAGGIYPTGSEIRFYYPQQQAEAQHMADVVRQSGEPAPRLQLITGIGNLPKDRLEVWLVGNTQPASGEDASINFSCSAGRPAKAYCYQEDRLNPDKFGGRYFAMCLPTKAMCDHFSSLGHGPHTPISSCVQMDLAQAQWQPLKNSQYNGWFQYREAPFAEPFPPVRAR